MLELIGRLRPARMTVLGTFDGIAWILAFAGVSALERLAGISTRFSITDAVIAGALCALAHFIVGLSLRLHQGRHKLGSFEDAMLLGTVVGVVGAAQLAANVTVGPYYRSTVAVIAPICAFVLMMWARAAYRVLHEQAEIAQFGSIAGPEQRAVVIGAGEGAAQLVTSMLRDPASSWRPVALLDDDPLKRHRRIRGLNVMGGTIDLAEVAAKVGATTAIVAIPSAPATLMRQLTTAASEADIELKVVPSQAELLNPRKVAISDIRDIDVTDLLGRHQVETDLGSIASYLTGKRVLVTGAGGSIGSELCRQIAPFKPAELMMLDRDESALHSVQLSIYGKALLDSDDTILGDIRDSQFMLDTFAARQPQVVFHAAALKHLPLLEKAPGEAIKTNVWGTITMLEAAKRAGVERFVNISTDKAANPCSVLGYSKRLAEGLTAAIANEADGTFLSVRFGNVLGSRGSVLTAFTKQIAEGGPVTVTDPAVTRYFMTIREACQLVIQAAAIGNDGEALVLDMGEPISIDAVARQLIDMSGRDIDIEYTGLRAGEKMHEELFGAGEHDERPRHPLISHTHVPAYIPLEAHALDPWSKVEDITASLKHACAGMQSRLLSEAKR